MTGRHSGFNLPLQATASVMPAVQLYNGEWNWVSVGWATGATALAPNWCYFPPAS